MFRVAPPLELKKLLVPFRVEAIFRHKVFRMLLAKGKITGELIAMLSSWRHSGFHVFCGKRISPNNETAMEKLARYIIYPEGHKTVVSRWCGTKDYVTLSETSVQLVIITSIENRKPLTW